jgi:hypothetical protein
MKTPVMVVSCSQVDLLKIKNIAYSNTIIGEEWIPDG